VNASHRRLAALVVGVSALLGACSSGGSGTVDISSDPELQLGQSVYNANCARCHGPEGGGGVGNRLNEGVVVARFPDIEDHIAVIVNGFGSMPAWEGTLTPEEIRAVARYEREAL
jgi:mono/diheme cytochrome c family protein